MHYTLHQLQIFLKVVEKKSITGASEELFLTQPAVSIQLKKFQDQFEIPLTEVVGRQLYVTDFGHEVAKAAMEILDVVDQINYKTHAYRQLLTGRLKLSIVSTGKYVMPYFLSDFIKANAAVQLVMDVTNKNLVIESLEKNEVDFALVSVLPDNLKVATLPLLNNELYLVASPKLGIDAQKVTRKVFSKYPLIYRESGSATRGAMEQFITGNNIASNQKIELTSNEAVKQAVLSGLGISIMPLIGLKNEIKNGEIQVVPFKGLPISSQWNLIWMQNKNLSPVANSFVQYLENKKDEVIADSFSWYLNFNNES